MIRLVFMFLFLAGPVMADSILAARTIRAQSIIGPLDIQVHPNTISGAADHPDLVIGMEARVALYAGRPIRPGDVGPPAIVGRNDIIRLIYDSGGLKIETDGRALGRGGLGDRIRVMNLSSRTTVSARVANDGSAHVSY
jgi:flagella basal body P-ring formation protein FlgA